MALGRPTTLLVLALVACPADPTFTPSEDVAADTRPDTGVTVDVTETTDTKGDAVIAECDPPCAPGFECRGVECVTCAFACEEVLVSALCGFDGCGGRCGCADASGCDDGECACPTGGCDPTVTTHRARKHHLLGFDMRAQPFVVTRADDGGNILLSRWNGVSWDVDTPIGSWGADRAGAAAALVDTIQVVHPATSGDALAVRVTRATRGREAETVDLSATSVCARPRLVPRPVQGDLLLGCVEPETTTLRFVRVIGDIGWSIIYEEVVVGVFDNTLGEPVLHDVSWTIDANGIPQVLAARTSGASAGPLVLATWAIDRWVEETIDDAVQPPLGGIQTALVRTNSESWAFYTHQLKDGPSQVLLSRRIGGHWTPTPIASLDQQTPITSLDAALGTNDFVHVVRLSGASYYYERLSGGVSMGSLDRELFGVRGFAFAVSPDGTPFITWSDATGLRYERADVAPE